MNHEDHVWWGYLLAVYYKYHIILYCIVYYICVCICILVALFDTKFTWIWYNDMIWIDMVWYGYWQYPILMIMRILGSKNHVWIMALRTYHFSTLTWKCWGWKWAFGNLARSLKRYLHWLGRDSTCQRWKISCYSSRWLWMKLLEPRRSWFQNG